MNHDRENLAIVKAVHTLGHELGKQTIAEQVETEAELASLKSMGVDGVQGYLSTTGAAAGWLTARKTVNICERVGGYAAREVICVGRDNLAATVRCLISNTRHTANEFYSMNDTSTPQHVNLLCLKWGARYGADYVNMLYRAVGRNLNRPFSFFCCTDDASGLDAGVKTIPFPDNPGVKRGWPDILVKLVILRDGFGDLRGPTLFLDLDVSITGPIDCFFDFKPGEFCIIHNWVNWRKAILGRRPVVGNSSVFRFEAGRSNYAYETFLREMHRAEDRGIFNTEQAFLTYALGNPQWWPDEWVRSYKWNCRPTFPLNLLRVPQLPPGCRILVFHGRPDPDEAIRGYWGRRLHHRTLPAPWIADYWKL